MAGLDWVIISIDDYNATLWDSDIYASHICTFPYIHLREGEKKGNKGPGR